MAANNIIRTSVILGAVDKMSGVIRRATSISTKALDTMETRAKKVSAGAFSTGRNSAAISATLAAPLIYAGKQAVMFEDKMADVAKVTDLKQGSPALAAMGEKVKDISEYLGIAATDGAQLYAELASGGVAVSELDRVAKRAGEIGIAFDISAGMAGEAFAKTRNALGGTLADTEKVMDAVNSLSDKQASKASQILTFLASGGAGIAKGYNLSGQDISAFGSTLISVGKSGEEASTIVERFAKNIRKNSEALTAYKKAGRGTNGFLAVLQKGIDKKTVDAQEAYFAKFGDYSTDIRALAMGMNGAGGLRESLASVSKETLYLGSVQKEFTNRQSTTLGKIKKAWSGVQRSVLDAGAIMLPIIRDIVKEVSPIIKSMGLWIRQNPELTKTILKTVAGLALFSGAVSALSFLIGGVATSIRTVITVVKLFRAGGALAGVIPWISSFAAGLTDVLFATSILTFPMWGVVAAIGGVGYVVYKTTQDVDYLYNAIIRLGTGFKALFRNTPDALKSLFTGDWDELGRVNMRANNEADQEAEKSSGKFGIWTRRAARAGRVTDSPSSMDRPAAVPGSVAAAGSGSGGSVLNYAPNITIQGTATEKDREDFKKAINDDKVQYLKIMAEAEKNKNRVKLK